MSGKTQAQLDAGYAQFHRDLVTERSIIKPMPCDGPSQEAAYKRGAEIAEKILAKLNEDHDVREPSSRWPTGFKEEHAKAKAQLIAAVQELVWIEWCDSF